MQLTLFIHSVDFQLFILFIMPVKAFRALSIGYNMLFLINSKVGIGYEKALRYQSKVPFFLQLIQKKIPNPLRGFGIYS
jgi:hypothetical protein